MDKGAIEFDVAAALEQGRRNSQEDAIATDFPDGAGHGIVVLADGMGGHCAGDVASRTVVDDVYRQLRMQFGGSLKTSSQIPGILRRAATHANDCLRDKAEADPTLSGMGSTLIALVLHHDALYWLSIGDSIFYLFRDGRLRRLNEDHSLAPQIDLMVKKGVLSEEIGKRHPDRSCLISALTGARIAQMDCPESPLRLCPGDVVIVASDGLQYISEKKTGSILADNLDCPSSEIAEALLREIRALDHPQQDNVCFSVVKVARRSVEFAADPADMSEFGGSLGNTPAAPANDPVFPALFRRLTRNLL